MSDAAPATIDADRPCAECGYSLRTLRIDGVCPECGHEVARSLETPEDRQILLAEDRVVAAHARNDRWRRRMAHVAWIFPAVFIGTMLLAPLLALWIPQRPFRPVGNIITGVMIGAMVLSWLSLRAWWGCRARCQHADFVKLARAGKLGERTEADRRRDDYVCRREDIYARNISAAKVLFVFLFFILALLLYFSAAIISTRPFSAWVLFTLPLVWLCMLTLSIWIDTGRRDQARSIRYHRKRVRRGGG